MSRILVADDEVKSCELLEDFFKMKGHDVIMAYSGMQAFEMVMSKKPDIVLLEIRMLERDGMEILKRIRKSVKNIGIIMLTALKDKEIAKEALKAGADDYITKPINYALLESSILPRFMKKKK
jgi:DNA-binding response OmpR family regulator